MPMFGNGTKTHLGKQLPQGDRVGGGVFDKLESIRAHRIIPGLKLHKMFSR
jgi:hypothetical protein